MTNEDKELIADYMGWSYRETDDKKWWNIIGKDGATHLLNSNDASLCVEEMQKRGEFVGFEVFALTEYQVYNPDMIESDNIVSEYIAWLYNAENFFAALAQWLREGK